MLLFKCFIIFIPASHYGDHCLW